VPLLAVALSVAAGVAVVVIPALATAALAAMVLTVIGVAYAQFGTLSIAEAVFLGVLAGTAVVGRVFSAIQIGPLYVTDAALAFIGLAVFLRAGVLGLPRSQVPPLFWGLLAAYLAIGVLAVAHGLSNGSDVYYIARDSVLALYAGAAALAVLVFPDVVAVRRVHRVLFVAAIPGTIFAGLNAVVHVSSETGTAGIGGVPVALGMYLSFFYLAVLARWTQGKTVPVWQWVAVLLQLACVTALTSRTTWLAFLAAVGFLGLTGLPERRLRLGATVAMLFVALVAVYTLLPPEIKDNTFATRLSRAVSGAVNPQARTDNYQAANASWRLEFWRQDIKATLDRPLTGVGFGPGANFCFLGLCHDQRYTREADQISGPHNSYVDVAYRMGIPGIAALIGLMVLALMRARRAMVRARAGGDATAEDLVTVRIAVATFLFVAITAFFSVALEGPFIGIFFWVTLALLLVLRPREPAPPAS
jgi:O-antigen ligase